MTLYAYIANSRSTRRERGRVEAASPAEARADVHARGLQLIALKPVVAATGEKRRWGSSTRVSHLIRELATLLHAGIPLSESLASIARQQRGGFAGEISRLRQEVERGKTLAEAMRTRPGLFDDLTICMVDVGERSGRLDWVLQELAAHKRRSSMVANKVGAALIYPAIVVVVSVAVTLFLMTFVVPRLLAALEDSGKTLPLATRVVKAVSDGVVAYWWLVILLPLAAGIGGFVLRGNEAWRYRINQLVFKIPILGDLMRKQAIVTLAVTLSTLLRAGVEFTHAVRIVGRTTPNAVMREALVSIEESVSHGQDLAPALRATGAFPDTVIQIVDAGQASGKLDKLLADLALEYSGHVEIGTQRLVALLEPAVIFVLAGFILLIVLAVMMPYLEASNVV